MLCSGSKVNILAVKNKCSFEKIDIVLFNQKDIFGKNLKFLFSYFLTLFLKYKSNFVFQHYVLEHFHLIIGQCIKKNSHSPKNSVIMGSGGKVVSDDPYLH